MTGPIGMKSLINVQKFHAPLQAAGLVPENCRLLEISIGVHGSLSIRYDVFLTAEQLVTLGSIFQNVGESIIADDKASGAQ
jgi:hypothetical protein